MSKPLAVLISDVHYRVDTLELADYAFRRAIDKAQELGVPLIDLGDITDEKAILPGKVVNRLVETMCYAMTKNVEVILLVGNHSLLNEKSKEHALNFLRPFCVVVDKPQFCESIEGVYLIPYQTDSSEIERIISKVPIGNILLMHQGIRGAFLGDYVKDNTSVEVSILNNFPVFTGHYHRFQCIGTATYVGNPYTLSFGEANDPAKGFMVLFDDYAFERILLPLRKHVKVEYQYDSLPETLAVNPNDLVWITIKGPKSELRKINKLKLGSSLIGHTNFKLDLVPTDVSKQIILVEKYKSEEIMDLIIDSIDDSAEEKAALKALWKELA